jgi:hypothetical protein
MSGIRNLTGICQDIHRNRANVDTPPSGPSTSSRSGRYYRRLSQVRRLVVTSAELVWRNAKTNFNGKVVKGMNEKFLEVGDVMRILGISRSAAYKLMRQINSELEKKGYIVIRGKVSRKYFEERIYGMSDAG